MQSPRQRHKSPRPRIFSPKQSTSNEKPLMATFLSDFKTRSEIKQRCGLKIARGDQKHNVDYLTLVSKLENQLYNIYCLAVNITQEEIQDINSITKPRQELYSSMFALISLLAGLDKNIPNDLLFKKSLDWVYLQSFFCQHFPVMKELMHQYQDHIVKNRIKITNITQASKIMGSVARKPIDYYLDRDAAINTPVDDRLCDLAIYCLNFYQGHKELEETNYKLGDYSKPRSPESTQRGDEVVELSPRVRFQDEQVEIQKLDRINEFLKEEQILALDTYQQIETLDSQQISQLPVLTVEGSSEGTRSINNHPSRAKSPQLDKKRTKERLNFPGSVSYETKEVEKMEYKPLEHKKKTSKEIRADIKKVAKAKHEAQKAIEEDHARKDYEALKLRVLERTQGLKQETLALATDNFIVEGQGPSKGDNLQSNTFQTMTNSGQTYLDFMAEPFYIQDKEYIKQKTREMKESLSEDDKQNEDQTIQEQQMTERKKPKNFLQMNKTIKKKEIKQTHVTQIDKVPEKQLTPEKKQSNKSKRDSIYNIDLKLEQFNTPRRQKEATEFGKRHDKQASIEKYKRQKEEEEQRKREEEIQKIEEEEAKQSAKKLNKSLNTSKRVNQTRIIETEQERKKRLEEQWEASNGKKSKREGSNNSILSEVNSASPASKKLSKKQLQQQALAERLRKEEEERRIKEEEERRVREEQELQRQQAEIAKRRRQSKLQQEQAQIINIFAEELKKVAQPSPQEVKRRESKREELTKHQEEKMHKIFEQARREEEERQNLIRLQEEQEMKEREKQRAKQSTKSQNSNQPQKSSLRSPAKTSPKDLSLREQQWDQNLKSPRSKLQVDTNMSTPSQEGTRKQSGIMMPSSPSERRRNSAMNTPLSEQQPSPRQLQIIAQKQNKFLATMDPIEEHNKSSVIEVTQKEKQTQPKKETKAPRVSLEELEKQLEAQINKTEMEIGKLQKKEQKLIWHEKKALKNLSRQEQRLKTDEQLRWNERQWKKNQRLTKKQLENEKNFMLENSAFRIELLSPRRDHNNKRYDQFDPKKKEIEDQKIEQYKRVKTLQKKLDQNLQHIKDKKNDIQCAQKRLYVQDSDESFVSASSLTDL